MADEPQSPASETPGEPTRRPADSNETASWHRMAGVGVEFVTAFGAFAAVGWWADGKFGTTPWLLIAGCGFGFAVGLWSLVRAAQRMMK
ncbi:MAG: hypothetical protein JWO31_3953 [Phycisphaerales bacterium]|nr:hypothetical protein [Phycisphaerales bacterium]